MAENHANVCVSHFVYLFNFLFIYFWWCWVFIATHGLSWVAASGGYSLLWWAGFLSWWLLLLQHTGSRVPGLSCSTTCGIIMDQTLLCTGRQIPPLVYQGSPCIGSSFLPAVTNGAMNIGMQNSTLKAKQNTTYSVQILFFIYHYPIKRTKTLLRNGCF